MTVLNVPKMSCGHCKATIEKAVAGVDSGASIDVDLESRTVNIQSALSDAMLIDALKTAGYESTAA